MINIIEKTLVSKRKDGEGCEDGLFINDNFVCVVDGVTSKGSWTWNGHTSGYYAKELVLECMKTLPFDISGEQAITALNSAIARGYTPQRREQAIKNSSEKIQANVIIFSKARQQIWSFGDCQCRINGNVFTHEKKIDAILSSVRALYIELEKISGKTQAELLEKDPGRELLMPILKKQSLLENKKSTYGFDTLNGFEIFAENVVKYDLKKGDEIVLSSDGYPKLCATLEESERVLSQILKNDPLCCTDYLSTKGLKEGNASFDDRTYVRFIV